MAAFSRASACVLLALAAWVVPSIARVSLAVVASNAQIEEDDTIALLQNRLGNIAKPPAHFSLAAKSIDYVTEHDEMFRQPAVTTTTHESWFSRMGNAFMAVVFGIVLIVFSIPCMWVNERRAARFESLIQVGEGECSTVSFDKAKTDNRGCLVHVSGTNAEGKKPLKDDRFPSFQFESKCLRISSNVEAYQWVEHEKKETKKDRVGGGETTVTTYTYTKEWSGSKIDSSSFAKPGYTNRIANPSMQLGENTKTCSLVHYGEAFQLPTDMVSQLSNFQDASSIIGRKASEFAKSGEYYLYPEKSPGAAPDIGDMRATFKYIPDGPATAIGLQYEDPKLERETFMPYRLVGRGCCCCKVTDEQLKNLQIKEAEKTPDDLYADDKMSCGPLNMCLYCCLGACNLVTYCFSGMLPPQVFHLFAGDLTAKACWSKIKFEAGMQKWILRLIAWLMMLAGLVMCFEPLFTAVDIIPFLGPYLSKFISFAVGLAAFIVTLIISTLIMSIAYLVYRPLLGMFYLLIAAACTVVPIIIIQMTKDA